MDHYQRQSRQDWAALRVEGCRGWRRLYWRLMAWWYGERHISPWLAAVVVALVALAILVSR